MNGWAVVGQIGAAIAAILGAIKLWQLFFAKRHRVIFHVEDISRPVPDLAERAIGHLSENLSHAVAMSDHELRRQIVFSQPGEGNQATYDQLIEQFNQRLLTRLSNDIKYSNSREEIKGLTRVHLMNLGKRSAKSLVIDINFDSVVFNCDSGEPKLDGKVVRMAELRPGQKITLNFWTGYEYKKTIRVTHEDHVVRQQRASFITGWRCFVAQEVLQPYVVFFVFAVLWVALGIFMIKSH